jgi:hypothetical protein
MFKNRFSLIAIVLFILIVSLAVSSGFSNAPKSAPDAPAAVTVDTSDYFARHPALRLGLPTSTHTILPPSLIDECFDVSVSELAACREASQSASQ